MERNSINNFKDSEGNWSMLNARTYFDIYSHEFKTLDLQEKLNNLGFLIHEGLDLPEIIMRYCDTHSPHIVEAVKPTLLFYIQQMRWSEPFHFTDEFLGDTTAVEMAMLVQDEIKARYAFGEVNCSNWDDSIVGEMTKRAGNDNLKFAEITRDAAFSKEYQNINTIKKSKDYTKHLIGTAGELAVANMLCLQGWVPSLTSNNCPSFDVFGYDPFTKKSCVIQVKTTKDEKGHKKSSFQLGFAHNKRTEWLNDLTCPYVFVHIDLENKHTFYILSAPVLKEMIIKTDDEYYNKKRVKPLNPSYPVAIQLKDMAEFENKWENLWK